MLQDSAMGRTGGYMAGTRLLLITLQDIQLHIQMTQKHGGQRQTHPGRYLDS